MGALSIVQDIKNLMTEIETLVVNEGKNTEEINLSKGEEIDLHTRLDKIKYGLATKIQTSEFIATINDTSHIPTGFVEIDNLHDELMVIDSYSGGVLTKGQHYTENIDGVSIDLVGWTISLGQQIKFTLYKSIK